jgi:hypothetical protein
MSAMNARSATRIASATGSDVPTDSMKSVSPGMYSTGKLRYGVPGVAKISWNRERSSVRGL